MILTLIIPQPRKFQVSPNEGIGILIGKGKGKG
jgi:hypothetical protein